MPTLKRDEARQERIAQEIVADAKSGQEQAMGWYCYLEDQLHFPFSAKCIAPRAISPLCKGDEVEILGMAPEEECFCEMFVTTPWENRTLAVPLMQLQAITGDRQTKQAVEDWHYWMHQGYRFSD